MTKALPHLFSIVALRHRRSTAGNSPWRATIVLAALVIPNILAAAARADATFSATLQATLTVAGFLDAEHNPIAKPEGLTLENLIVFFDDEFIIVEGDAAAEAEAAIDVIADDPTDLVAGDRFVFDFAVTGATVYPTGFAYAGAFGNIIILAENASPDPVTISFDFDYDYALSTSVGDPALEQAYAIVEYWASVETGDVFELFTWVDANDSRAHMGTELIEVTLQPGQSEVITVLGSVAGDPFAEVPEPTSWMLGALGTAMLLGAARRRRSSDVHAIH